MKKTCKYLLFAIALMLFITINANALVQERQAKSFSDELVFTTWTDYFPFGFIQYGDIYTAFDPVVKMVQKAFRGTLKFYSTNSYQQTISDLKVGKADFVFGAYTQTKIYDGLEFVYPAVIDNPIVIAMLPHRIAEVKDTDTIKKMKGAYHSQEYFSDFVKSQMKFFDLTPVDNSYQLFELLFTGKVDFVFGGQYFLLAEASKLGLRNSVSISKQALYNIPVFIGISKMSKNRKFLFDLFSKLMEKPETKQQITDLIISRVNQIELDNKGTVPPAYSVEESKEATQETVQPVAAEPVAELAKPAETETADQAEKKAETDADKTGNDIQGINPKILTNPANPASYVQ